MKREAALAVLIALLIGAVGLRAPVFLSATSLGSLLTDTAILLLLALGQMLVLLTRGVDLSVASNLALTGMIVGLVNVHAPALPVPLLLALAALIGAALGAVNGLLIGALELPPIVITLGTMSVFRGLIYSVSGGVWLGSELGHDLVAFPLERFLGLSHLVWLAFAALVAAAVLARRTRFGRDLYAIGNHAGAARNAGVPVRTRLFGVYTLSGAIAGFCGALWVGKYAIAYTELAYGFELTVIAACVIGGVSIAGGRGSVAGTALGALFVGVIGNALPVIQVSPFWQTALTGAVILVAVIVNAREGQAPSRRILAPAGERA